MRRLPATVLVLVALIAVLAPSLRGTEADAQAATHGASGFRAVKTLDQVACGDGPYHGGFYNDYFTRGECGFVEFTVTGTDETSPVKVNLIAPDGSVFETVDATHSSDNVWRYYFTSDSSWPAGKLTVQVFVEGDAAPAGEGPLFVNYLTASIDPADKADGRAYEPGEEIPLTGTISEITSVTATTPTTGVPAAFSVQVRTPTGEVRGPYGPFTAASDGTIDPATVKLPAEATAGLTGTPEDDFEVTAGIDVIDASYDDPISGAWAAEVSGSGAVALLSRPDSLILDNEFVSSVGWVKPGDAYPFRVHVKNLTDQDTTGAKVTIPAPSGVEFTRVQPLQSGGAASIVGNQVVWNVGDLSAAADGTPTTATLVVEARAMSTDEDPRIVWKDLSSTATLTYDGYTGAALTSESHGPKVIPPTGDFETARYGDKPFPMVPVDFRDRKHESDHSGQVLERVVNSPNVPGSTFNLYQEMSFGQLFPDGFVPSAGIAQANFSDYEPGFTFTSPAEPSACRGTTLGPVPPSWGTPVYPDRIQDGWYQLPGDTEYYGGDDPAFSLGLAGSIDGACGPTAKGVYDAAQIADPEIDYNQFDSDKDGVVDFFMMIFVGLGGNGDSQINGTPPYDNIWPHSSSLEFSYADPETGLRGYISDDQLTDLEGVPQCWIDDSYQSYDDCQDVGGTGDKGLPVYVRVGPYNVNPESAIDAASVISHEYGHHLGLPDFYSGYASYGTWNLMAADHSQHMTVFSKQDLGWVVPQFLEPGDTADVKNWSEIKNDTGAIQWRTPDGEPYTLSAANGDQNVHNGQVYGLKLPGRLVIDPDKVAEQASATHVWYSGRGNDFGCSPAGGHNLDLYLPELEDVPAGTPVTLSFKSSWDIEWDWDYGFVLTTTDGKNYTSVPSANGYTTDSTYNPNGAGCIEELNNGLTGQSGAYEQGEPFVTVARNPVEPDYATGSPFIEDSYDISALAGEANATVRLSYFTDPAFDRPGWFIDDLEVKAGDEVIYADDFEDPSKAAGRLFPGGCDPDGFNVAARCTEGWTRIKADQASTLDHGYYLELRDRSGFDFDGHGQSDRGLVDWFPGVLIEYTDEVHGYGNNGVPQPPAQQYLDSQPIATADCDGIPGGGDPVGAEAVVLGVDNCADNAFTAAEGDSHFDDNPNDDDGPWVDNFENPDDPDGEWKFGYDCLTLDVAAMSGDTSNTGDLPSDLTADATITAGEGCAPFTYGVRDTQAAPSDAAPTAVAQAKPTDASVGQQVTFDGSGSSDDTTAPEDLEYTWAFGDGATASGQVAHHAYAAVGTYDATLLVTDQGGNTNSATVTITVSGAPAGGDQPLPTTGGGFGLLALMALAGAGALMQRLRPARSAA